jgi:hypothetical protein
MIIHMPSYGQINYGKHWTFLSYGKRAMQDGNYLSTFDSVVTVVITQW